jgi:hypothetical protein
MKERVPLWRKHLPQRAAAAEVARKRRARAQVEMRMQFRARLFNKDPERDHRRQWSVATKGHHLSELTESGQKWPYAANAEMYFNAGTEFAFLATIGFAAIAQVKWSNRLILIKCSPSFYRRALYKDDYVTLMGSAFMRKTSSMRI